MSSPVVRPSSSSQQKRTERAEQSRKKVVARGRHPHAAAQPAPALPKKKRQTMAQGADKYALYRLAVQDPAHEVDMFQRFYKDAFQRVPRTLREDFCAAAAVCCEWVNRGKDRTAIGVDLDPEPLAYGRTHYLSQLDDDAQARVQLLEENVLDCEATAEVVAAQNYSFFIFKTRELLLQYFKAVHRSLADEGILVTDMMGGGAMQDADVEESRQVGRPTPQDKANNPPFRYVWDEASFNPITHDILFHIHFRFPDGSAIERAFTYDWRLWTLPELRELLSEAGFSQVHIYWETEDKDGQPSGKYRRATVGKPDLAWLCYIVAVK